MKLERSTLNQLDASIGRPNYPASALVERIVHIGVGGFHRAHEAVYTHRLLQEAEGSGWGICGVGLREADRPMFETLNRQEGLYTLIELHPDGSRRLEVIGAIRRMLLAPEQPDAVMQVLVNPEVRIVSLTITEGGYNVDDHSGEFRADHPDVRHDLAHPESPVTVFGYLAEALNRRRAQGIAPFTILSCDNLPHNGDMTRKVMVAYARLRDPSLAEWIDTHVSFPNSMVDRITPVTLPAHREWLKAATGLEDAWPVVCEPFTQWVLEDDFCNGRPEWEKAGVQFVSDVTPYELMKLRLLNASHSAMAYLGLLAGYRYTHDVMADPLFSDFIRAYMDEDATPVLGDVPGMDLDGYKQTLIERFGNPQMGDLLTRLASDGSGKLPKFVLPTVEGVVERGMPLKRVALILASWACYLHRQGSEGEGEALQDPNKELLLAATRSRATLAEDLLGLTSVFGTRLQASQPLVQAIASAIDRIEAVGGREALSEVMGTSVKGAVGHA
ncbi:MAG: mannitol dehydrogenase family protein [Gammaproteobacteria bacterium]|nr:MAG: mannitol dehydrogenase family protein [Gammaproteobacteria bacterium]